MSSTQFPIYIISSTILIKLIASLETTLKSELKKKQVLGLLLQ